MKSDKLDHFPSKYYRLTPAGRRALAQEEERWARYVTAVERISRPQEA